MSRLSKKGSLAFLSVALGAISLARDAAADADTYIKIAPNSGDVEIRRYRAMPWRPAPAHQIIPAGTDVHCPKGCSLSVGGIALSLDPGASIALAERFFVPLEPGQSLVAATRLELKEGALEARTPADGALRPMVITNPNFSMVAFRAATVRVLAKGGRTLATAIAGSARVASRSSWTSLGEGEASQLSGEAPPSSPYAAPTTIPSWTEPRPSCSRKIALAESGRGGGLDLCWNEVKAAPVYRVEIAHTAAFDDIVETRDVTTNEVVTKALPRGHYFARVSTVDAQGNVGTPSTAKSVGIVEVELPPGGVLERLTQTVVVPLSRDVRFTDAAAFEVAFAKGPFHPMPSSIRAEKESMAFRLRFGGDASSETPFFVDDRAIRADIQLTPKTATWPVDAIDIVMQIRDPSGRVDPATIEPHTQVLIDREEIPVQWSHEGAMWRARLLPRQVNGPTVVRVIAADQTGASLGRGFVEVAARR